jgi:transcriptional regulator with XRE-family HTH domain
MDIIKFWKRVKFLIKTHKTSQEKIAIYIGIPYKTLRNWIYYNRVPDLETAVHLAVALGASLEYLVYGDDRVQTEKQMLRLLERKSAASKINKLAQVIVDQSKKI